MKRTWYLLAVSYKYNKDICKKVEGTLGTQLDTDILVSSLAVVNRVERE